jgi:hypothetical protein
MACPLAFQASAADLYSFIYAAFSDDSCVAAVAKTFDHVMTIVPAECFDDHQLIKAFSYQIFAFE